LKSLAKSNNHNISRSLIDTNRLDPRYSLQENSHSIRMSELMVNIENLSKNEQQLKYNYERLQREFIEIQETYAKQMKVLYSIVLRSRST
jgi:hypothetical protein